jgi:hypothetical protein
VIGHGESSGGVRGVSNTNVGVSGMSTGSAGISGTSTNYAGVTGFGPIGLYGSGFGPGNIGVRADGTSWFHGDSTPLANTTGTGIAVGTTSTDIGYIFAIDYNTFASKTLALNSPGGRVGVGTLFPDQTLSVNGNASKSGGGSWLTFSDERLKNLGKNYRPGLKAVMQLQPLFYEYKKNNALGLISDGPHVGFSAQALQKVLPDAVTKDEKGYLLVNNDPIIWTLLNAVKEQQVEILALKQRVDVLSRSHAKRHRGRR